MLHVRMLQTTEINLGLPALAGAFYLRLVGRPLDVYNYLEPLLSDFRKVPLHNICEGKLDAAGAGAALASLDLEVMYISSWRWRCRCGCATWTAPSS